jgi:O-methyltransferase
MAESPSTITKFESHMSDPGMRKLRQDQAVKQFYLPLQASRKLVPGNLAMFRDATLETIGDRRITYLEFGVADGISLRSIISRFTHAESRFFGFDSFEGLPEAWVPLPTVSWKEGAFSRQGDVPAIDDRRVEFVRGWFQNTLPPFLSTGSVGGPWPHLVHYDADLYSSTLFILTTLWHYLPEYYFIMDEFPYDEVVALSDFAQSYPVEIRFIAECGDKVFGSMRRVPFSL